MFEPASGDQIRSELERITHRLQAFPPFHEAPMLYAAQQALSWALDPAHIQPPFDLIAHTQAASEYYSEGSRLRWSSDNLAHMGHDAA